MCDVEVKFIFNDHLFTDLDGFGCWVAGSNAQIPKGAVIGGIDEKSNPLYIVRVIYEGQYIPGYLSQTRKEAVFGYGLRQHVSNEYDFLVATKFHFIATAVPFMDKIDYSKMTNAGQMNGSKLYYVARAKIQNAMIPGKFDVIKNRFLNFF